MDFTNSCNQYRERNKRKITVLLFPSFPKLMEDLLLLLKGTGFYLENAATPCCCFKKTEIGYCFRISSSGIFFACTVFSVAYYNYDDETAANCWSDYQAFVKQLIFSFMKALCLESYFQIASWNCLGFLYNTKKSLLLYFCVICIWAPSFLSWNTNARCFHDFVDGMLWWSFFI